MGRGDGLNAGGPAQPYPSFAALGDSFTEGLDDPSPDRAGYRGWADRVAEQLAGNPDFRYANLAVRGRLMPQIVAEQVPAAVALQPALVSLVGGTNDALRRHFDAGALEGMLRNGVARLTDCGARVLLFTGTDLTRRLPGSRRLAPRIAAVNDTARTVAAEYGCLLVDLGPAAEILDSPAMWSEDRLHLNGEGHRRVAGGVLATLGLPGGDGGQDWLSPPTGPPPVTWRQARADDARWLRAYVGPWMHRRVTGRSSGDAVHPKRPSLEPYD